MHVHSLHTGARQMRMHIPTYTCMPESVYDSDHDSAVRIFIGLSCELRGFSNYITLGVTISPLPEE